jgi:serine/threonine protein kinase/Leucine-rich repeat (LRR) protein
MPLKPRSQKAETGVFQLDASTSQGESITPIEGLIEFQNARANPRMLGPYRIERHIGQGGMGFVYEAFDTRLNRRVALKTIESGQGISEQVIARFRQEARNAAILRHPNIVPVHDVGRDHGFDYFTMDLVEGVTLDKWAASGAASIRQSVVIMEKVSRGLHYAHEQGILHRDVKPGNIMIDGGGEPRIMDFGLARNTKDTSNLTLSGSIVGTPAYMAPEQTIGSSTELGVGTDIWGLGVVLYEIIVGKPPFDTGNIYQTIYAVLHNEPEKPRKISKSVPHDLEVIILKCLEKQPTRRYSSAEALADDLKTWLEGGSISIRGDTWWEKLIKKLQRSRAISMDEFMREQQARQRLEAKKVELEARLENEAKQDWRLVFEDNFSDPNLESRWELFGGNWEIKDGELRVWGGEPQVVYVRKEISGDIRMEFECHQESEYLCDITCFTHALPLKNRKKACESGYTFAFGATNNTRSVVEKPKTRLWDKMELSIVRGIRYRIAIERRGSKLSFSINDVLQCEIEDEEPLTGSERTSVGFYSWRADNRYSNVKIYQLGAPVKGDLLDIGQRQLDRGRYESATDLFQEVIDSSDDPIRVQRARHGIRITQMRAGFRKNFSTYQEIILCHWPKAKLDLDENGISLDIQDLGIKDLSPIKGMQLNKLVCSFNEIESLEPLRGMSLSSLNCEYNKVDRLNALRGMSLHLLNCGGNRITDLEPLIGMRLETLIISRNPIKNYELVSKIPLTYLGCICNDLTSLEFLRGLPLMKLNIRNNKISDLSPLRGMPLRDFDCHHNCVADLEPLRGMDIQMIGVSHNPITSLEPLRGMKFLRLECFDTLLTTLDPFVDDPPIAFAFDCETLSSKELERVAAVWSAKKSSAKSVMVARTILASREKDISKLKSLAMQFENCLYLFIPRHLSWHDARKYCEELGGELLTIENNREKNFYEALDLPAIRLWIGCMQTKNGIEWLTKNRKIDETAVVKKPFGIANPRKVDFVPNADDLFPFVIKWRK